MAEQSRIDQVKEGMQQSRLDEVRSTLDKEILTPIVCTALQSGNARIEDWDCIQIQGGISGNQIYKISGRASTENNPVPWSLFLKILNQATDTINLNDTDWQREPLAYQEGLVDHLPAGFRAAECYRLEHKSATEIWMWLEDVSDPQDRAWPLERYGLLARYLGQLNGRYLIDRPLPSHPWIMHEFERKAIPRDCNLATFNTSLGYLRDHNLLSSTTAQSLRRLWDEKELRLDKLYNHLPQTFSHFDSDRRNIFSRATADGEEEIIAIDWGLVGIGPIGAELRQIIFMNLFMRKVDIDQAKDLYGLALDGYLQGLADSGWQGNSDLVRYGCAAITGLWLVRLWSLCGAVIPDEGQRAWFEESWNLPFAEIMVLLAQLTIFSLDLVDEATAFQL